MAKPGFQFEIGQKVVASETFHAGDKAAELLKAGHKAGLIHRGTIGTFTGYKDVIGFNGANFGPAPHVDFGGIEVITGAIEPIYDGEEPFEAIAKRRKEQYGV